MDKQSQNTAIFFKVFIGFFLFLFRKCGDMLINGAAGVENV